MFILTFDNRRQINNQKPKHFLLNYLTQYFILFYKRIIFLPKALVIFENKTKFSFGIAYVQYFIQKKINELQIK